MRFIICTVLLVLASISDLRTKTIPVWIPIIGAIIGGLFLPFSKVKMVYVYGLIFGLAMVLLSLLIKNKLGIGDGLMITVVGLLCGIEVCIEVMFIALMLTSLVGIVLCVGRKELKEASLPFMPFMLIGIVGVEVIGGIY